MPIDLRLGEGYTALVITGPNTGGKTVALRTLGLLALMHQAGLHVPAEDGLPPAGLPRRLRGHRRRAVHRPVAVHLLGPPALHHPDRGQHAGPGDASSSSTSWAPARTPPRAPPWPRRCSTTSSAPGRWSPPPRTTRRSRSTPTRRPPARNASVEFDLETLSPTYRLTIGLPGGSQAFAIAERLGLPGGDRRRRAEPPVREPARVRGDARVDPPPGGRDRRGRGSGARRGGQGRRGAAVRGRGAPAGPPRARRGRQGGPRRGPAPRGRPQGRRGGCPPPAGAGDRDGAGHRRRPRARRADPRAPPRGAHGARAHVEPVGPTHVARWASAPAAGRGGWEGRIAALEKGGTRATLEAGRHAGLRRRRTTWSSSVGVVDGGERRPSRRRSGPPPAAEMPSRTEHRDLQPAARARRAAWPRRWTCAGPAWTRPSTPWRATSTTRRWRAWSRSRSSTASARVRCGTPCAHRPASHPLVKSFRAGERGEGGRRRDDRPALSARPARRQGLGVLVGLAGRSPPAGRRGLGHDRRARRGGIGGHADRGRRRPDRALLRRRERAAPAAAEGIPVKPSPSRRSRPSWFAWVHRRTPGPRAARACHPASAFCQALKPASALL